MAKINSYIIMYNNQGNILDDYDTIQGKTPKDALKKAFNEDYERLTGDAGRYASIILIKGTYHDNNIYYEGRGSRLCFGVVNK